MCASGRLAAGGRIFITFKYFRCCFRLGRFGSNASLTLKKPIEVWPSRRTRRVFGRRRGTAGTCLQKVAVATATAMRPDSMGPWLFLKVMCNHVCSSRVIHSSLMSLSSHSLGVPPCATATTLESLEAFESSSSQASSKEEEEVEEEKTGEDGEETVQKVLESYKLESWCSVFCCRPTCDKYCLVWTIVVQVT